MKTEAALISVVFAATLTACGGGGSTSTAAPTGAAANTSAALDSSNTSGTDNANTDTDTTSSAPATARSTQWTIVDLGTLGGSESGASALNGKGEVVGWSKTAGDGSTRAFVYRNGVMTDLGTLGGVDSHASAINDLGDIVGYSTSANGQGTRAFVYRAGSMIDLGTLGGASSQALDINNLGQIVGWSKTATPDRNCFAAQSDASYDCSQRAFLYADGTMTELGTLGGPYSVAHSINNHGEIAGESYIEQPLPLGYPGGYYKIHAFTYSNGAMRDIGTLGGNAGRAHAINDSGLVVGESQTNPPDYSCPARTNDCSRRAFVYANDSMTMIATLGGLYNGAAAINNKGHVVGNSTVDGINGNGQFLYADGAVRNLNDLQEVREAGWELTSVAGINDAGQMVGVGTVNGKKRAFLLTPPVN